MKLIIAGTRTVINKEFVFKKIDEFIEKHGTPSIIIQGGCRGVDAFAKEYAENHKLITVEISANWEKFGKQAGPIRNSEMAKLASFEDGSYLLAFWDHKSRGTKNMINTAVKYGLGVEIVDVDE